MSEELLAPLFSRCLNSKFRANQNERKATDFELIEVENRASPNGYECFTLRFRAPLETPLEQGTYRLESEQMPGMEIFMVPTSQDEFGVVFEAVYNRLLIPRTQES